MMNPFVGKVITVMVFVRRGTEFEKVDSVLGYAVRGHIKRGYTENYEHYYKFDVYPSQIESFVFECKEYKIQVRVLD